MTSCDWDNDALEVFAPSVEKNVFGPLADALEVFNGAYLYEYRKDNQRALVAVRPVHLRAGTRMEVVGLRSVGERLQAKPFFAALDGVARAHGARVINVLTQVPHVANACKSAGFGISGAVLLKVVGAS